MSFDVTEQQVREAAADVIEIVVNPDNLFGGQTQHEKAEDAVVERLSKLLALALKR